MAAYNKSEIREKLDTDDIFNLVQEWGGEPEYTDYGLLLTTICHNKPGEGSRKLYYYENTGLFRCYTGCGDTFDIFELAMKIFNIQKHQVIDLNSAIRYVAYQCGIVDVSIVNGDEVLNEEDWKILENYERISEIEPKNLIPILQPYDETILSRLNYNVKILPWERDNISEEAMTLAHIGFYPGGDQITIPHYDYNGNFIGLRGRTLIKEDAEKYGKYRPIKINKQLYTHPLGFNLYGLNWNKDNIKKFEKAIVFESEKAVLQYETFVGRENNIAVACCGSNLSACQVQLLKLAGAKEIIVAFDRQFKEIDDDEFKHLTANLTKIHNKYSKEVLISFLFDKDMITSYKASPIDEGIEKFLKLYSNRIFLN